MAVIGATNNYKWKGTSYNTYQISSPWVNHLSGNELVDWTDIDAAEQLFAELLDPNTGEPVLVRGTTILVTPAYRHAAHRIVNATQLTFSPDGTPTATLSSNPVGDFRVFDSRLAYRRIMAMGVAGMGKLVRIVPHSIVVGFTIGIAVTIALSQIGEAAHQECRMRFLRRPEVGVDAKVQPKRSAFEPHAATRGQVGGLGLLDQHVHRLGRRRHEKEHADRDLNPPRRPDHRVTFQPPSSRGTVAHAGVPSRPVPLIRASRRDFGERATS